jgi:hypothetical protein
MSIVPCNSRLPFNDDVQNRRYVQYLAHGKVYEYKVKKGPIRTTMSGSGWRLFVHENGLCRDENIMLYFNMIENVWRIDILYLI